ncbi:hypothetical protein D3C81_2262270 [compost metagenome]
MQQSSYRADKNISLLHLRDQRRHIPHTIRVKPVMSGCILAQLRFGKSFGLGNNLRVVHRYHSPVYCHC